MPRIFSPKTLLKQQLKALDAEKTAHQKLIEHYSAEANKAKSLAINHGKTLAQKHGLKPGHPNYSKQVGEFAIRHPAWQKFKTHNDKVKQIDTKIEEIRNKTIALNKDLKAMTTKKVTAAVDHAALLNYHREALHNLTNKISNDSVKAAKKLGMKADYDDDKFDKFHTQYMANHPDQPKVKEHIEQIDFHRRKLNKEPKRPNYKRKNKTESGNLMDQHLAKYNEHFALAKTHAAQAENMTAVVVANTAYKSKQKRKKEASIQQIHVELAEKHNKLAQQALAQANNPIADVIITANKTIYNLHNELIEANTLLCDSNYQQAIQLVQAADKNDNPQDKFASLQYKQKATTYAELLKFHQAAADSIAADLVIEARIKKEAKPKPLDKQTIQQYLKNYKDLVKQHTNLAKLHQRYAKDADKIRSSYNRMLYNQHVDMAKFHQTQAAVVTQHSKKFYINANEYLMAKESKADKFAKVIKDIPAISGDKPIKITAGTKNKIEHHKKRYEYHRKHAVINLIKATRYANKKTAKQFGVPVSTAKQKIHHSQEAEFVKAYKEHFNNCKACDRMHKHAEKCKNCQAKIAHYESKAAKKSHKSHATSNNFFAALNELVASANKD